MASLLDKLDKLQKRHKRKKKAEALKIRSADEAKFLRKKRSDIQQVAEEMGLDTSGTKKEIVNRILDVTGEGVSKPAKGKGGKAPKGRGRGKDKSAEAKKTGGKTKDKRKPSDFTFEDLIEKGTERETKKQDDLKKQLLGYVSNYLPEQDDVKRSKKFKSFCLPPSIKQDYIRNLKNKIQTLIDDNADSDTIAARIFGEQSLVKRLYALTEVFKRIPVCDPEEMKDIVELVTEGYPENGYEELIETIKNERIEELKSKNEELETNIENDMTLLLDADNSLTEEEAYRIARDQQPKFSEKKFLNYWWFKVSDRLAGTVYDGEEKNKPVFSPCGLKMDLGKGNSVISRAEDLLAFIGSKDDWEDFYLNGGTEVENGETFRRMSPDDWPGCIRDLFEGRRKLEVSELKKIAKSGKHKTNFTKGTLPKGGFY